MCMRLGSMKRNKLQFHVGLVILAVVLSSCSVQKNHKFLSVFFDGVPKPVVQKTVIGDGELKGSFREEKKNENIFVSSHPDFVSRDCQKCHSRESSNFLVTDKKKLCFTCHDREDFNDTYIHGPVSIGECSACHKPHQSKNIKLLLSSQRKMCGHCHERSETEISSSCGTSNCLRCHDAHSGDNRFFIKKVPQDVPIPGILAIADGRLTVSNNVKPKNQIADKKWVRINRIRMKLRTADHKNFSRIVLEGAIPFRYQSSMNSDKLTLQFIESDPDIISEENRSAIVRSINYDSKSRVIRIDMASNYLLISEFRLSDPFRVVFDVRRTEGKLLSGR